MSKITEEQRALVARILDGPGEASAALRKAAFANDGLAEPVRAFIDKVARCAFKVTGEDIDTAKASGLSEDQIFEIVVCGALGQATRQYETALAALDAATEGNGHAPRDPR
jgi:hypothetical protein